jgi:hypothetical protein
MINYLYISIMLSFWIYREGIRYGYNTIIKNKTWYC